MSLMNKESIQAAYDDVRDDNSETTWFLMSYEDKNVVVSKSGIDYEELLSLFNDDERNFAYLRVTSGDEMSKRAKFVFITWIGQSVSPLKKGKVSVEKGLVKAVVKTFAVELLAEDRSDLEYESVMEKARKAGGANYGTGQRD